MIYDQLLAGAHHHKEMSSVSSQQANERETKDATLWINMNMCQELLRVSRGPQAPAEIKVGNGKATIDQPSP